MPNEKESRPSARKAASKTSLQLEYTSLQAESQLTRVLSHFRGVKKTGPNRWQALCPAHNDKKASLSVAVDSQRILLHCHAGCSTEDVIRAAGLQMSDLFFDHNESHPHIAATYDYTDENGALLFQVVRYSPKGFRQRRPDGHGGWIWNLSGVKRVLYRLPELVSAGQDDNIFIVEGEKDVDRLRGLGLTATTNAGGAGKWKSSYNHYFRDRDVILLPDNDEPGRKHADEVKEALTGIARSVTVVELPGLPAKGDVSDWLTAGHSKDELRSLVEHARMLPVEKSDEEENSWDRVRELLSDKKRETRRAQYEAAQILMRKYHFANFDDRNPLLVYKGGYYQKEGEKVVRSECEKELNNLVNTRNIDEVIGHVRRSTYVKRESFEVEPRYICLQNGIYDLETRKLLPHSPDFHFLNQIPTAYDPNAHYDRLEQFLHEVLPDEDIPLLDEIMGYCLYRGYPIQKAVMLIGEGGNGKSTTLTILRQMLGSQNVSSGTLQQLGMNRFAAADLFGKLANIAPDLPANAVTRTGIFKALTGHLDQVRAEFKFGKPFDFTNYAKLLFSANQVPRATDDTRAFYRRWILLNFPNKFEGDKDDPDLPNKLASPVARSALLNHALKGLHRLLEQKHFSYTATTEEIMDQYQRLADSVNAFRNDCLDKNPEGWEYKDTVYNAFTAYCRENKLPTVAKNVFSTRLQEYIKYIDFRPRIDGERKGRAYKGFRLICPPF